MNFTDIIKYLSTKTTFPDTRYIYRRIPFIFIITLISFFIARPIALFAKIPLDSHWQLFLGYPILAVMVHVERIKKGKLGKKHELCLYGSNTIF